METGTHEWRNVQLRRVEPGLPTHFYYDRGHYERELEVFWYRMWIMAGREEELPAPRDYRVVRIGSQGILLLRDLEGRLRAFHNTCRHRGSILCTEERGRLPGRSIVCPYHAWTYGLDGRLAATPHQIATPDFDRRDHSLFEVAVDTWGGFVFVNLAGTAAAPLSEALGRLPDRYRNYGLQDLRIGKRIVMDVRANWKLLLENFAECFHCPRVHPELCAIVTAYREAGAWGIREDRVDEELRPEYAPDAVTLTLDGSSRIPPFRGLTEDERRTLYSCQIFRPNLFLNVHPDYVNVHQLLPTGPESVRMTYDWLFEPESMRRDDFDLQHYVELWDRTNRQDARNCEWQQEGIHCRELAHGSFVPQEQDCYEIKRWVLDALGETG